MLCRQWVAYIFSFSIPTRGDFNIFRLTGTLRYMNSNVHHSKNLELCGLFTGETAPEKSGPYILSTAALQSIYRNYSLNVKQCTSNCLVKRMRKMFHQKADFLLNCLKTSKLISLRICCCSKLLKNSLVGILLWMFFLEID